MPRSKRDFESLMAEYAAAEDSAIRAADREWRDKVPPELDRAVRELSLGLAPAAPLLSGPALWEPSPPRAAGRAAAGGLRAVKAAAIGLGAAALVSGGAYTLSPAFRDCVSALFPPALSQTREQAEGRSPGDYLIPSPGEVYSLTDEARSERLYYRWFSASRRLLLVELAYRLPEEQTESENVEYVELGGLWGTLSSAEGTELLILRDGEVFILIELFNGSREELFTYAETLIAANQINDLNQR